MLCAVSSKIAAGGIGGLGTFQRRGASATAAAASGGSQKYISASSSPSPSSSPSSARWLATHLRRAGVGRGGGGRGRRASLSSSSSSRRLGGRGFAERVTRPAFAGTETERLSSSSSETSETDEFAHKEKISEAEGVVGSAATIPEVAAEDAVSAGAITADATESDDSSNFGAMVAGAVPLLGLVILLGAGAYYKDDITSFLLWFTEYVDSMGPSGPALFMSLYVVLEVLAVPAIPLTMSAGAIFGSVQGTAMVSLSATTAAAASFLIARYALRDKIKDVADQNPKFAAIDNAIGEDSFRVVALLRLSPLLPFALSNYLYGLTSVKFKPYVLASWLGMLPGTFAYVSAGSVGMTIMEAGADAGAAGGNGWTHVAQVACGFAFAVISGAYVARLATDALKDVEEEMNSIEEQEMNRRSSSSSTGTD